VAFGQDRSRQKKRRPKGGKIPSELHNSSTSTTHVRGKGKSWNACSEVGMLCSDLGVGKRDSTHFGTKIKKSGVSRERGGNLIPVWGEWEMG